MMDKPEIRAELAQLVNQIQAAARGEVALDFDEAAETLESLRRISW